MLAGKGAWDGAWEASLRFLCTSCKEGTHCAKDKHEDGGKCELYRDVTVVCLIVSDVVTRSAL
jgi:hypothetical protein